MKKKRIVTMVLSVCLMVFLLGMNAMAYTNVIGKSGSKGANIRAEASTSAKLIASVPANTEITICGEVKGSDGYVWYYVFVDKNQTGYIRSDVVTKTDKAAGGTTADGAASSGTSSSETSGSGTTKPAENTDADDTPSDPVISTESDCALATVKVGSGELTPEFDSGIFEYTLTVAESVDKITVYAVTRDTDATLPADINFRDLQLGKNDRYIVVTGSDGSNTASYHFTVIRGDVADTPEVTEPDTTEPTDPVIDPTTDGTTDDTTAPTTDDTQTNKTSQGGISKWIVFAMAIVIAALILVLIYMAVQMRDMRETIDILERERRRRKKKPHPIQEQTEQERPVFAEKLKREPIEDVKPYEEEEYTQPEEEQYTEDSTADNAEYNVQPELEAPVAEEPFMEETAAEDYAAPVRETASQPKTSKPAAGKQGDENFHPVNFLAPDDDMEFEFLNLDDE